MFLTRSTLEDSNGANFFKEFSFLHREDIAKIVLYGCQHWLILKKIHERAYSNTQAEGEAEEVPYLK